jgi:hypothetical protein
MTAASLVAGMLLAEMLAEVGAEAASRAGVVRFRAGPSGRREAAP